MKHLILLLLVSAIGYGQVQEDYIIVNKALEQLDHLKSFTLLKTPNNLVVSFYLDGFEIKSVAHFKNTKFSFNPSPVHVWEADEMYFKEAIAEKVDIIEEEPRKTMDAQQARSYLSLSNPAFSENGKFAIISVDLITNYTLSTPENTIFIFKRENEEWIYLDKFTGMLY